MAVSIYSRYHGLAQVTSGGRQSLAERPMPRVEDFPDSLVHVVTAGQTLEQLAFLYYGREDLWWQIADHNPGRDPLDVAPGDRLLIPPLRVATRTRAR